MNRTHAISLASPLSIIFFGALACADVIKVPSGPTTIQAAVTMAGPNDIIEVSSGIYNESFTVADKTDITIKAKGKVILNPTGGNPGITIFGSNGIKITGITIEGGATDAISIGESNNIQITKCKLIESGRNGIFADVVTALRVENNTIDHCIKDGVAFSVVDSGATGVVDNSFIIKNKIIHAGDDGIDVNGNNNIIEKNIITDPQEDGVELDSGGDFSNTGNIIRSNTIKNAIQVGIIVYGTANTAEKNQILKAHNDGVQIDGVNCIVTKNRVQSPSDDGIFILPGSTGNTVSENTITKPSGDGVDCNGDTNTITKNKVSGSGDIGFEIDGTNNTITSNKISGSSNLDIQDTNGAGVNVYSGNKFKTSNL